MKIAILGTENSHARAFAELIRNNPEKYHDIELVGVYGYDNSVNEGLVKDGLVSYVADKPEDFLGKVDGVMITARHGDLHHAYGMPYAKAGIPMFIDKPFAVDLSKAKELLDTAIANKALLCGGSSLKYLDEILPLRRFCMEGNIVGGMVAAPINMVNEYGGFYFYAQHLIEILFGVFGDGVKSVYAKNHGTDNRVSMVFDYGNFDVTGQYYDSYVYTATVFGKKEQRHMQAQSVTYCYEHELDDFIAMARTGIMPHPYESLVKPLTLMHCIEQSCAEHREVPVVW